MEDVWLFFSDAETNTFMNENDYKKLLTLANLKDDKHHGQMNVAQFSCAIY